MRIFLGFLFLAGTVAWIGCTGQAGIEGTIRVTGTVLYQGQPVENATVVFAPEGQGRAASGQTDSRGRFQLTTLSANDGALPGKYQVAVSKIEVIGAMSEEESLAYVEKHGKPPEVIHKSLLPEQFKTPDTSGLAVEVIKGGKNDFTFDLTNHRL